MSLALIIFNEAGLLTGGTAGIAFVLHYATGINFGKLFFIVNLPFYWFSWTRMGREFTIKTFLAIGLLSLLTEVSSHVFDIETINPADAAILGGLLLGTGCLYLARHRASLGGATIVTLFAGKARLARRQDPNGDRFCGRLVSAVCYPTRTRRLFGAGSSADESVFMGEPQAWTVYGDLTAQHRLNATPPNKPPAHAGH